jgi:hypothetical protein
MKNGELSFFHNLTVFGLPIIAIILLATANGLNKTSAIANTQISLDDLSRFPVMEGEIQMFSGRLIRSSTMQGISDATINIVHQISFDNRQILVSGQTDANGFYSIPWAVNVERVVAQTGGSFGTENTQGRDNRFQLKVLSQFDGDSDFTRSTSNTQSIEVRLNQLRIQIEKKVIYLANEGATVKIMINDISNNLVDPDKITSRFDNNAVMLVKQNTGTYVFSVAQLSAGNHQLQVHVEKRGHVSDDVFITLEAMKRKTSLIIATDKSSYHLGESVSITASLIDQSSNKLITDRTVTGTLTSPKLAVQQLTFVNGKTLHNLKVTDAAGTWTVFSSFPSDRSYFASLGEATFTVTKPTAVVPSLKEIVDEKVSLSRPEFVDNTGIRLEEITVGQQVMIQTKITSNFETMEDITYINQVKDVDGFIVALSWITSTLVPSLETEVALSWVPKAPGEYTAEVFVWKSLEDPEPLSYEISRSTIDV